MNELEIIENLDYNPILKKLLIDYISRIYEENAIFDDYHLMQEYFLLKRNNELHLLFVEEKLINYLSDGSH